MIIAPWNRFGFNANPPATHPPDYVVSFNGRPGPVTLTDTDITGALGFTPISAGDIPPATVPDGNKGDISIAGGTWTINDSVLSAYGRSLTSVATATLARNVLGLGSVAVEAVSSFPITVTDRTALAALSATSTAHFDGSFWDRQTTNLKAEVDLDPTKGVYVPFTGGDGTTGAWVRRDKVITPFHFGAVGNLTTNDLSALQAANDWFFAKIRNDRVFDIAGGFGIAGTFNLGPPAGVGQSATKKWTLRGQATIQQLTANTFETVVVTNGLQQATWLGGMHVVGKEGAAANWSLRTCGVGITIKNSIAGHWSGKFRATGFWYHGIYIVSTTGSGTGNNDEMSFGYLQADYCGSGQGTGTGTKSSTWTLNTRTGANRNLNQREKLNVASFPNVALIETYQAVSDNNPVFVRIGGEDYQVMAWDTTAGTIDIFPWLDAASHTAASGTLYWVFGAGVALAGADSNIINCNTVKIALCGIGLQSGALYGIRANLASLTYCGIGYVCGNRYSNTHMGDSFDNFYPEANNTDILLLASNSSTWNTINSSYALDLSEVEVMTYRDTATDKRVNNLGGTSAGLRNQPGPYLSLNHQGIRHIWYANPVWESIPSGATHNFTSHTRPPQRFLQYADTQTINLQALGSHFNRLYGYRDGNLRYLGTGTNGAPTGSFTFVPPAGGTVNGGAADASAVFSGFTGPADFEVMHTDEAQLTWIVRQIAGSQLRSANNLSDLASPTTARANLGAGIPEHPGYVAGRWYAVMQGNYAAGGAGAANSLRMLPFQLSKPITVQALGVRITTAAAAGNVQLAIYAHDPATGRPTGGALCSTGSISTAATGPVSAAVTSVTLQPGTYWFAVNTDLATAAFSTVVAASPNASFFIGSTSLSNVTSGAAVLSLTLVVNFGFGSWPANIHTQTFIENTTTNNAAPFLQAA